MNITPEKLFELLRNKTVAFCGLGRSHLPTIRLFREKGIRVIACDSAEEDQLKKEITELKNLGVETRQGKNCLKSLDMDIIFRTPGMKFSAPELVAARQKGIVVTSEMEVFFDLCPCEIIGITGSDGKTTTSSIIAELLKKAGKTVHLGGNIGSPLLPLVEKISENDIVVVELSSFQLISMRKSPDIAVITNIAPNHLDMHADMDEYVNAKKNIMIHQNAFSTTILNFDNEITKNLAKFTRGNTIFFSNSDKKHNGFFVENDQIYYRNNNKVTPILKTSDIKIPGQHNVENFMAGICATLGLVGIDDIQFVAKNFSGVEHRIEFVREINGIKFFNDSIASSPTRTIRGILSLFDKKILLIAGGYDKKIPFDTLGAAINEKVKILILLGQTAQKIENSVKTAQNFDDSKIQIFTAKNMLDAVNLAHNLAHTGDIVALSPACASFDLYKNFEIRGKDFKNIVNNL